MKTTPFRFFFAAATILTASPAFAATYQWDTNGSALGLGAAATTTWDTTTANWDLIGSGLDLGLDSTQAVSDVSNANSFSFGGTAGTVNLSSAITSIGGAISFATTGYKLNVGASGQGAANTTSISGAISLGLNTLTLNALGNSAVNSTTVNISGAISGSGTLALGSTDVGAQSDRSFINITGNNSGTFTGAVNIIRTIVTVDSLDTLGGATGSNITLGSSNSGFAAGLTLTNLGGAVSTSRIRFANGGNTYAVRNNDANAANTLTLTNSSVSNPGSGSNVTTLEFGGTNTGSNTVSWNIVNPTPGVGSTTIAVRKADSGTWVLTGANTFTAGLTISAGTLVTGNTSALGSGSVTLSGGALKVGNGTVQTVSLASAQNITTTAAAKLVFDSALSSIALSGGGKYDFSGDVITLDLNNAFNSAGTYSLITGGTGNVEGTYAFLNLNGAFNASFANGTLTVAAVPEPLTYALLGAGSLAAAALVRRRNAVKLAG